MTTKQKSYNLIKAELAEKAINAFDPVHWDKPLWVIYDYDCFPSIVCLKINNASGTPSVWGYSLYRNTAGFRTLGQGLSTWMGKSEMVLFFDVQEHAMAYLNFIVTPKAGAI